MDNEQWKYKIGGKTNVAARLVFCFVLSALFTALAVDQLVPLPNKYLFLALAFGFIAVLLWSALIRLALRFFCFKVYIGREGFYFQSNPFNGKYYEYSGIESCGSETKIARNRGSGIQYYHFFTFTEKSGRTVKFQFEKTDCEKEINELEKRIEKGGK